MRCRLAMVFVLTVTALISGCVASSSRSGRAEIDFDRIEMYTLKLDACFDYLHSLIDPAIKAMNGIPTLAEIRRWVSLNPDYELSKIASMVRAKTRRYGPLDPSWEPDRVVLAVALYEVLEGRKYFNSSCHDEVLHEIVMDMIHLGVIHKDSDIRRNMLRAGFNDVMDRQWALLFTLMAADVKRSVLADPIVPEGRPCNLPAYEKRVSKARGYVLERGEFRVPSDVLSAGGGYACALVVFDISDDGSTDFISPVVSYPSDQVFESAKRALAGYRFKAPKSRYGGVGSALIIETGSID